MRKRFKIHLRSTTAVRLITGVFFLGLWIGTMYQVTKVTTYGFRDQLELKFASFPKNIVSYSGLDGKYRLNVFEEEKVSPGAKDNRMIETIMWANQESLSRYVSENHSVKHPLQTAVIFLDPEGNILQKSGDYLYFHYMTEEKWKEEEADAITDQFGWIDLEKTEIDNWDEFRMSAYTRISGTMNGNEMIPVRIDYCDVAESDVWVNVYEKKDVVNEEELITIYANSERTTYYEEGNPVQYGGKIYENLLELLEYKCENHSLGYEDETMNDLVSYIRFSTESFYDEEPSDEGIRVVEDSEIIMATAIMAEPWKLAMNRLYTVYIISLVSFFIVWVVLNRIIKSNLIQPLQEVNKGMSENYSHLQKYERIPILLQEVQELRDHYQKMKENFQVQKNEINRLNRALDYSKKAEESRRQMTSNIAHELKTPLAIIHSYSEGLKERIAEDKKDEYYDVILSETERMDAMVLEMLDLSRLEAGKVKIARDEFSMSLLVQTVYETMAVLAEGKGLSISVEFDGECMVFADESRIYQVVSNFLSNAIRYTPEGGDVNIRVAKGQNSTSVSIENTSNPFSNEELDQVWDTFYRVDESRNSKGTGLGLAIAKNIVELHGGKCSVKNTKIGVEFRFVLFD